MPSIGMAASQTIWKPYGRENMGIFESIKNAFSSEEPAPDVTVAPSQLLREAGIDPGGLKFGFGTGSITVSGEIAQEADRQKILDTLSTIKDIHTVTDNMTVAAPAVETPVEESAPAPAGDAAPETVQAEAAPVSEESEGRTYTVESGDTLWAIADRVYGNGSKYKEIFEANRDLLDDPDKIFPGQKLRIPELGD